MERQLDAYCAHLRNERQVSPHTLEAYRRDLNKVLAYCEKQQIGSTAVVALSHQGLHGVLAIASRDPAHYKSSVGTLFLTYIAEVLGRILPRFTTALRAVR